MGVRGPLPSPVVRRRNRRPDRGAVVVARPVKPRGLSPKASEEWTRVVDLLDEMNALHGTDHSLLIRYCSAWAEWCELDEQVAMTGRLVKGVRGNLVRNPLWAMRRDTGAQLSELATQLGITPVARLRSGVKHERSMGETVPEGPTTLDEYRRAFKNSTG